MDLNLYSDESGPSDSDGFGNEMNHFDQMREMFTQANKFTTEMDVSTLKKALDQRHRLHFSLNKEVLSKDELGQLYKDNFDLIKSLISTMSGNDLGTYLPQVASYNGVIEGMFDLLKLLIDAGANVNALDDRGRSALHMICNGRNSIDAIEYLVSNGADVNIICGDGRTALIASCSSTNPHVDSVSYLIAHGSLLDVQEKYYKGDTALMRSIRGKNYSTWLDGYNAVTRVVIASGCDLNIRNGYGKTALHLAAIGKNMTIVRELIAAGADDTILDDHKRTALSYLSDKKLAKL